MEVYFAGNIISLNGGLFIVTFYRRVAEDSPSQPTNQPVATNQWQSSSSSGRGRRFKERKGQSLELGLDPSSKAVRKMWIDSDRYTGMTQLVD